MNNLSIMKDASEIVHYNNPKIPLYIKKGRLSFFTHMRALCHWHDDIEFLKVVKGHMNYYINGNNYLIQEDDAMIVNSRQMHYGYSEDKTDCEFICILFKPQLLCNNMEIINKYINPVMENSNIAKYHLDSKNVDEAAIIHLFNDIFKIQQKKEIGYELNISSKLNLIWMHWFKLVQPQLDESKTNVDENIKIQKNMVQFIYRNYHSKISLNEIAQAGNVCRSKCCQLFKKYLNKTPIEFLNAYRLEISMALLRDTSLSITEIAHSCGFNSPSYYTEIFSKYKGCTPGDYRLQQIKSF